MSPHTVRNYLSDVRQLLEYLNGRTPPVALEALTYQDLRGFLAVRHTLNRKTSVARKLAALRTFCSFLVRREVLPHNLAALAPTPKLESPSAKISDHRRGLSPAGADRRADGPGPAGPGHFGIILLCRRPGGGTGGVKSGRPGPAPASGQSAGQRRQGTAGHGGLPGVCSP